MRVFIITWFFLISFSYSCAKEKPIIYIVPGGPMLNSIYLEEPLKDLKEKFNVRFIDLPGRGSTPFPKDSQVSFINDIKYIEKVRQNHGDNKLNFLGHSYGGYVALGYLNIFPKHVNKIIIVSTPIFINDSIFNEKRLEIMKRFYVDSIKTKKENIEFLKQLNLYDTAVVEKKYLRSLERCLLTFDTCSHFQIMNKMHFNCLEKDWEKIFHTRFMEIDKHYFITHDKTKFLICSGKYDLTGFLNYINNNIGNIKNIDLEIYRSSHLPFYEEHDRFIKDVYKFMSK